MGCKARRVVIVTHSAPEVAGPVLDETLAACKEAAVEVIASEMEFAKHSHLLKDSGAIKMSEDSSSLDNVDLCLVLGGDGTMLRAFHLMEDRTIPVAGVNLGRVGFLTTVDKDSVGTGVERLLLGEFTEHPLLGLEAQAQGESFQATNDVVVAKGDWATAISLEVRINGVTLFEVSCDGVVASTPAGSSAYNLAAGGPLVGISVDAYVISVVAPHALGVRPVVAGPRDVLEIVNKEKRDCCADIDGQRVLRLHPGSALRIRTIPGFMSLALLEGDSLYQHFRDRLL